MILNDMDKNFWGEDDIFSPKKMRKSSGGDVEKTDEKPLTLEQPGQVSALVRSAGDFAGQLYLELSRPGENFMMSGYSVYSVLAMLSLGAKGRLWPS